MGTRVIDKASQQVVEVDNAEAQVGLQQGRYGVLASEPVQVKRGTEIGEVDPAELATALAQGWELSDLQEQAELRVKREEDTALANVQGFVEAGAAGASLGLSTMALEGLGVDPDRMRARRENLGAGATVAEVGGGLAALLGTGGGSLAARGAVAAERGLAGRGLAALGAPTRAVEALGQTVERGVAGALGGGRMARVVAPTARGAVEGYFAGAGAQIDENVLGRREQTAESIFVDGRLADTLFGAGIGAGLPIAAEALRAGAKIPPTAMRKVLGHASGVGEASDAATRAVSQVPEAGQGGAWLDTYADAMGIDRAAMRDAYGLTQTQRGRDLIFRDLNEVRGEVATAGKRAVDDHNAAYAGVLENITRRKKLEKVEQLLDGTDTVAIRSRSAEVLARGRQHIDDALSHPDAATSYIANDLRATQGWYDRAVREIAQSTDAPALATFRAMERLKQDIDNLVSKRRKAAKGIVSPQLDDTISVLRRVTSGGEDTFTGEAVEGIRSFLESPVWGKAGELQQAQNAALSGGMQAVQNLREKSPALARMFDIGSEVDEAAVLQFVRNYTKAGGKTKANLVEDVLAARERAIKVARENYDIDADDIARLDKAEKSIDDLRGRLRDLADTADASEVMSTIRRAAGGGSPSITALTTLGPSVGGVLGSTLGPVGAAAGFALGRITDPFTSIRTLAALRSMADRVGAMRSAATGGMFARIAGPAAAKLKSTAGKVDGKTPIVPLSYATAQERKDRIDRVRHEVAMLATRPDLMRERLERSLQVVNDVAPGTAGEIGKVAQRAAMFLASKQPKTFSSPFSGRPPIVDPGAADRYLRYVEAVEHPIETLALLDSARLTAEHAEAIQAVYPELWMSFREDLMEALGAAEQQGREVPYRDRLQLAVLVDLPTTLTPQQLLAVQAGNAATAAAEQVPTSIRASDKASKVAENAMTSAQRTASGIARA